MDLMFVMNIFLRNQKQIKEQINEINGNVNVLDFMNFKNPNQYLFIMEYNGMNILEVFQPLTRPN